MLLDSLKNDPTIILINKTHTPSKPPTLLRHARAARQLEELLLCSTAHLGAAVGFGTGAMQTERGGSLEKDNKLLF